MWDQFKQSAYFIKPRPKYTFSASLPCTAISLESYILQLKQCFWHVSLPSPWHLQELLTEKNKEALLPLHSSPKQRTDSESKPVATIQTLSRPPQLLAPLLTQVLRSCMDFRLESPLWVKNPTNKGGELHCTWMTKAIAVCAFICMADSSAGEQ